MRILGCCYYAHNSSILGRALNLWMRSQIMRNISMVMVKGHVFFSYFLYPPSFALTFFSFLLFLTLFFFLSIFVTFSSFFLFFSFFISFLSYFLSLCTLPKLVHKISFLSYASSFQFFPSIFYFLFVFFISFLAHPARRARWAYAMVWRPSTVLKMLLLRHFSTDFDSDCFIR